MLDCIMSYANIKIPTVEINLLKNLTKEKTGQKAIMKALAFFFRYAKQRQIADILKNISFDSSFQPLKLRNHER
ncbi:MAG: hypothetical protein ACD_62C00560G0007 [uncultured bacterium]|nr:MAG: hypothetical protein ACD_62C00560G0007 [uncultured bacterium]HLD44132.1 hypothetical protein [bacterium]